MAETAHEQSVCLPREKGASDFLNHSDVIIEGDTVIVYVNFGSAYAVDVKRGQTLHMRYGALKHEFLIGKRYGSRVSATAGYVYALRPNSHLWTKTLLRRTQILYTADCGLIIMLLDAKPGSIICESGTGSGSLSHALAMAIATKGHLYTHDIDGGRVKQVEKELAKHGLADVTSCIHQNVCENGFYVSDACNGVFLDLPAPWTAIKHAKKALRKDKGGRIVNFSPCIEQVQRVCVELEKQGFVLIETMEIVPRKLKVSDMRMESLKEYSQASAPLEELEEFTGGREKKMRLEANTADVGTVTMLAYPNAQPTHTGYLTCATLLPSYKP